MIRLEAPSGIPRAARALLLSALAFGTARSATAQVPDSTRRDTAVVALPEIEVTGSIAPTAGPGVGSGVPARISVISGEVIDLWEPRTLPDALGTEPGFTFYDDLGSGYKTTLSTRGFSAGPVLGTPQGVSVFVDGVRQNQPDAAEINFDLLPLDHVKRVEFLHGTGSLLGPNSLGGSVNLITQRGEGPPHGELELSGGSYGLLSGEASVAGAGGPWDYYVGAGGEGRWLAGRHWRPQRQRLHQSRSPVASWRFRPAGVLRGLASGNGGQLAGGAVRC